MNTTDKKTLKIIFVIRYFHPFIGGMEKKTLNLASVLIQKGVRVEVVTSKFFKTWPSKEIIKGVSICRLPSPRIKIVGAFIFLISLGIYLIKNRSEIKIIHAFQVGYSSAVSVVLGRLLSKATVLSLSSSGSGGDVQKHMKTPWGRIFLFLCGFASRVIVLNIDMKHELQAISSNDRAVVNIPNGVDLTTYHMVGDQSTLRKTLGLDDEKIILYTGRLSPEKGVDFLLLAYTKLRLTIPTKLYILGEGPQLGRLQKLVKEHALDNRVKLLPAVKEVEKFLQIADVFVMPSRFEGLSNSLLEAMACGLPVIATRVEGNVDLIEDGVDGVLIAQNDIENLVQALRWLLLNPKEAHELGLKAFEKIRLNYDLKKVADQYIQLYESLWS